MAKAKKTSKKKEKPAKASKKRTNGLPPAGPIIVVDPIGLNGIHWKSGGGWVYAVTVNTDPDYQGATQIHQDCIGNKQIAVFGAEIQIMGGAIISVAIEHCTAVFKQAATTYTLTIDRSGDEFLYRLDNQVMSKKTVSNAFAWNERLCLPLYSLQIRPVGAGGRDPLVDAKSVTICAQI